MNRKQTLPEGTPGVLGGMFAVWNDKCGNGISEQDVHLRSFPAMQVLAEKLWKGENKNVTYEAFAKLCKTTPEAPGINLLGKVPAETALTEAGKRTFFLMGKRPSVLLCRKWVILIVWSSSSVRRRRILSAAFSSKVRTR